MATLNLCIIKPNKNAFSETFVQEHIDRLPGNKKVLYGGAFPLFDDKGKYLIKSKLDLLSYLIQKRILKKQRIAVRDIALKNYLVRNKIDVVFAEYGTVGAMVTEACRIAGVPLVVHFHGADAHHHQTVNIHRKLYAKMFSYASAIISVSGDMVGVLKSLGAPPKKIHLSSCGVDTEAFPIVDITNTPQSFLFVGRFVEKKSPTSVIRAFQIVQQQLPNARLVMVGDGPLMKECRLLTAKLNLSNYITFTGALKPNKVKAWYKTTRCFVQHSVTAANGDKEGTPVTILEAGSSGLAIISTLHAGIKEAVINNETGYLVAEHDIQGMATYMIKFAADAQLAADMGKKEAAYIRQNFDTRDRINTISQLLYKAVKTHTKNVA